MIMKMENFDKTLELLKKHSTEQEPLSNYRIAKCLGISSSTARIWLQTMMTSTDNFWPIKTRREYKPIGEGYKDLWWYDKEGDKNGNNTRK